MSRIVKDIISFLSLSFSIGFSVSHFHSRSVKGKKKMILFGNPLWEKGTPSRLETLGKEGFLFLISSGAT